MNINNDNHTVFWNARQEAALLDGRFARRAEAAEMIGISEGTLANYETGKNQGMVPETVNDIADAYNAPYLKNWYCKNACPIGRDLPIATDVKNLEALALKFVHEFHEDDIKETVRELVSIAEDGHISIDEIPALGRISEKLDGLLMAVSGVKLICDRNLRQRYLLLESEVSIEIKNDFRFDDDACSCGSDDCEGTGCDRSVSLLRSGAGAYNSTAV